MDPYSETCVKHDRALRFITRDHLILNSVLRQDCSVLGVLKSNTFRKPRLELLKLLAKKGKSYYVLGSRKLYRQTKCIFLYIFLRILLMYMISKKNPSHVNAWSRSITILFAVRHFNFHLIIFSKFKWSKHFCKFNDDFKVILIQAETAWINFVKGK